MLWIYNGKFIPTLNFRYNAILLFLIIHKFKSFLNTVCKALFCMLVLGLCGDISVVGAGMTEADRSFPHVSQSQLQMLQDGSTAGQGW